MDSSLEGFKAPTDQDINNTNGRSRNELATNINDKTLDVLRNIAVANEMVIVTRPVNKIAFSHMKAGAIGKNIFVHGKSAPDSTIAQGLIPMRSSISKAGKDDNVDKIKTYNEQNNHSITYSKEKFREIETKLKRTVAERSASNQPGLSKDELLAEAKIPTEVFDALVSKVPLLDKYGNQIYIFEDEKGRAGRNKNTKELIYAIKKGETYQLIDINHEVMDSSAVVDSRFKPVKVEVMGKPEVEIGKDGSLNITKVHPMTADIDILAYGTKANLQEFDKITSHTDIIRKEKIAIVEASKLILPTSIKKSLINQEIDQLMESEIISEELKGDSKFQKLTEDLKNIEVIRENLRGMGDGSEVAMALTGHMRSEFKDKVEISHGAEQFNLHFTQPMDSEWVLIDNKGRVKVVHGEEKLVEAFNKFTKEGLSMPPNPNWGWKLENGQYEIDPFLKAASNECNNMRLHISSASDAQKSEIKDILELQTKIGIESIKEVRDEELILEGKKALGIKLKQYNKKYLRPEDKKSQINKIEAVNNPRDLSTFSKNSLLEFVSDKVKLEADKIKSFLERSQVKTLIEHLPPYVDKELKKTGRNL